MVVIGNASTALQISRAGPSVQSEVIDQSAPVMNDARRDKWGLAT
jgi:hypothetical protein